MATLSEQNFPKLILPDIKDLHRLDVYRANGGYDMYRKAISMQPADVIEKMKWVLGK